MSFAEVGPAEQDQPRAELAGEEAEDDLLTELARGAPLRRTLEKIAIAIERRAPGVMASVLLVESGRLRHGAAPSLPEGYNRAADGIPIGEGFGSCGTAAHRGETVIVEDIRTDPLWSTFKDIAARYGLGACWSTPIFGPRREVVATFALYYRARHHPRPDELRMVRHFAQLTTLALEYDRMRAAEREAVGHYRELVDHLGGLVFETAAGEVQLGHVSPRAAERLGLPRAGPAAGAFERLIHPEDREATLHRQREALTRGDMAHYEAEYRLASVDGRPTWARTLVTVRDVRGSRCLRGVVIDITRQREVEAEREELVRQLASERSLLRAVIAQVPEAVAVVSADGRTLVANDAYQEVKEQRGGRSCEQPLARALASGEVVRGAPLACIDGEGRRRELVVSAAPIRDEAGRIIGAVTISADVSEKSRTDALQRLLVDAGAVLAGSREGLAAAQDVTALAVRDFAEWAALFTAAESGELRCVALAHRDPARAVAAAALDRLLDQPGGVPFRLRAVVRSGEPVLLATVSPEVFEAGAVRAELLHLVRGMGAETAITVPLTAPTRVLGAMVFVGAGARPLAAGDLPVAQELARRVALSLENARLFEDAANAIRHREEFLSIAAHELRTPLASLRLTVQTMGERLEQPEPDLEYLRARVRAADRHTRRLDRLMQELLDVAVFQLGHMRLQRQTTDLATAVDNALGYMRDDFTVRGIDVAFHAPRPVLGRWDPARIEQVITNLLSNALKYGEGRAIRVFIEATDETATLQVQDDGLGIDAETVGRLFRPFERGVSAGHYGGLGLGLHITEQIVRAHGGQISVKSTPGEGSTFTVQLPRRGEA